MDGYLSTTTVIFIYYFFNGHKTKRPTLCYIKLAKKYNRFKSGPYSLSLSLFNIVVMYQLIIEPYRLDVYKFKHSML